MAVGGLVMSSTRAVAILFIATVVFGVSFSISQWALLIAVFVLTLAALYGFGMMLASLFVHVGPRGLPPDPADDRAGLLRLRPELPGRPAGRSSARSRSRLIPLAVGLDAMRQLAFAATVPDRHARARIEALILVAMTVIFIGLARWLLHSMEERARARRPAHGALAMSDARPTGRPATAFDPARARGRGTTDRLRSFRTAAAWAGRWRPTGPTRSCSSSTRWPSPSRRL